MNIIDNRKEKKKVNVKKIKEIKINENKNISIKNKKIKTKKLSDYCNKDGKINKSQLELSKKGVMYRFNKYNLTQLQYIMIKIIISLLISFIFLYESRKIIVFLISFISIYICLNIYITIKNKEDNTNILYDICNIYIMLNININKGMYINDILKDISLKINNTRLKYAFDELICNINSRDSTIDEAIILFNNRFDSKEYEKLSIYISEIIKQGITEEIVNRINNETGLIIDDINNKYAEKSEESISIIADISVVLGMVLIIYWMFINYQSIIIH